MVKESKVLSEELAAAKYYLLPPAILSLGVSVILALTLIFTYSSLDEAQRWFLIIVSVLFPIVGLAVSIKMIVSRMQKLSAENAGIEWRIMSADRQQQKLNGEILGLAKILNIPENQIGDLRSAYIVAEDLALRHIEKESQKPVLRHISIGKPEFDALMIDGDIIRCVEVTFLVTPDLPKEKIGSILRKIEIVNRNLIKNRPHTKLILLLALVTQLDHRGESKLRAVLSDKFSETPVDVDIRLFDFEELQKVFTAE